MELYPYQQRVEAWLQAGKNVIIQAPTGAGKTRAALMPFLGAWEAAATNFPRQCIYAVPMRVLANQFQVEYQRIVAERPTHPGKPRQVSIQTGARPTDRRFEADLIFTTIDQVLSSFLSIPYSLGNRQANVNAGALISSYLVFDEFHLFPIDESGNGALATTIEMLRMLKGVTPFVLMTATFSKPMLTRIAALLDAEVVTLTPTEVAAIPSQQGKQRRFQFRPSSLSADAIIEDLLTHARRRVLAICNTVQRAQALAQQLRADPRLADVTIELLHSRFYESDRREREDAIRQQFGEDRSVYRDQPIILVATQVIEVGLNITCEAMHTELAPAAALVQRAGRCARFTGESGTVMIYELPSNEAGGFEYAPYGEDGQQAVCALTRTALQAMLPPEGRVLQYHDELALVDAAHSEADTTLLTTLHERQYALLQQMYQAMRDLQRNLGPTLIREVNNRTVLIHPDPNPTSVPNPYRYQSLGLSPGQLQRWFAEVNQCAWDQGLDWIARIAQPQEETDDSEGAEQRRRITTHWLTLAPAIDPAALRENITMLWSSGYLVALNPALVQYDRESGLILQPGLSPTEASPLDPHTSERENYGPICHESYAEHIAGLYRVYQRDHAERTAAARLRLEQANGLPTGTLERAIRLMFAVHDLGKLDQVWQQWAHTWQAKVASLRGDPKLVFAPRYMAAHTDFNAQSKREHEAQARIRPPRPPHAAESARAGYALLKAIAENHSALTVALMSAIICHHSAKRRTNHGPFKPAAGAKAAFYDAMRAVDLFNDHALRASGAKVAWDGFTAAEGLSEALIRVEQTDELLLYLFLVRILRLCDQGSQEHTEKKE